MLCFVFAALVVVLDQLLKRWVVLTLALREDMTLIPGVIGLTHEENPGAAFSILSNHRWLLVFIALIAAILLVAILLRYNDGFWGTLGLAAVLGGTVGNLIDRLFHGYVVDMFELYFMNFAIFNIADIFITLGGITFLVYFIMTAFRPSRSMETQIEAADEDYDQPAGYPDDDEDQIGLYDFDYGDDSPGRDSESYDDLYDTKTLPIIQPAAPSVNDYSGSDPGIYGEEPIDDILSALDALSDLESDFLETDILENYDLDELLREYGFEDDAD